MDGVGLGAAIRPALEVAGRVAIVGSDDDVGAARESERVIVAVGNRPALFKAKLYVEG